MTDIHELLTILHSINRWLVVVSGAIAVGTALAARIGKHRFATTGRRLTWLFLATIVAQAASGVLATVTAPSDADVFDSDTAALLWHALGGVLAFCFVATALIRANRTSTDQVAARKSAFWTGLGLLSVGSLIFTVPLTAAVVATLAATGSAGKEQGSSVIGHRSEPGTQSRS